MGHIIIALISQIAATSHLETFYQKEHHFEHPRGAINHHDEPGNDFLHFLQETVARILPRSIPFAPKAHPLLELAPRTARFTTSLYFRCSNAVFVISLSKSSCRVLLESHRRNFRFETAPSISRGMTNPKVVHCKRGCHGRGCNACMVAELLKLGLEQKRASAGRSTEEATEERGRALSPKKKASGQSSSSRGSAHGRSVPQASSARSSDRVYRPGKCEQSRCVGRTCQVVLLAARYCFCLET